MTGGVAPTLAVVVFVLVYGLGFGWLSVARHDALRTNAEDLGFTDQVIWNFLRGQAFRLSLYERADFETDVDLAALRRPDSFLAFHVEPIIVLFAPLYLVVPDVRAILWLQAVLFGLGAIPAYRLARRRLRGDWFGVAFAAVYLLAPLGHWALYSDFHTVALAAPLLMLAIEALDAGRWRTFLVAGLLATATKEEVGLLFAGLGAVAGLRVASRRVGLVALLLGAGWSLLCVTAIIPWYSGGAVSPFTARYAHLGAGPSGALLTGLQAPGVYLDSLARPEVIGYVRTLLLAGGWLALLAPELLIPAAPVLALNALSSSPWMASGRAHYSASLLPFVIAAAILGAERLGWVAARVRRDPAAVGPRSVPLLGGCPWPGPCRLRRLTGVACAAVLVTASLAYRSAGGGPLADGFALPDRLPRHELAARLAASIPREAPVSASTGLLPHLSQRPSAYLFPTLRDADYVFVDVAGNAFPISPGGAHRRIDELLGGGEFRVLAADDGLILLERDAAPTRPLPDSFFDFARADGTARASAKSFVDGAIHLVRAELKPIGEIGPLGPLATLETIWKTDRPPVMRLRPSIDVAMRDGSRQQFYDLPTVWWYPPERWRPGEHVRIDVPSLPLREVVGWTARVVVDESERFAHIEPAQPLEPAPILFADSSPRPEAPPPVPPSTDERTLELRIGELVARVERDPWRMTLLDPLERPFWRGRGVDSAVPPAPFGYRDAAGAWWRLTRLISHQSAGDTVRLVAATDEPNGRTAQIELRSLGPRTVRVTFSLSDPSWVASVSQSVEVAHDERFLGFGERFDGVDQRGRRIELWAQDRRDVGFGASTYAPIPFFVSSRGYSFALESDARARFDVAASDTATLSWELDRPSASYVLSYGPSPRDLVQQHAQLTGLPPLPPVWAFGVWKTAIGGEQEVLRDAARLRAEGVPVSALLVYDVRDDEAYLGWPFVGFGKRRPGQYPDPRRLTDRLHAGGFKVLGYKNADLHVARPTRPTPATESFLVRTPDGHPYVHPHHRVAWVDFTNPAAVSWWSGLWRRALADLGFDGGMLDLGELVPEDAHYADGTTGIATHNRYLGLYAKSSFEAAQAARGDDFVVFARSASRGAQRYQSLQWSGDQLITWDRDGIQGLVPAALSMGISGFPYWHPEVAGFLGVGLPAPSERELWFRWLQLGAMTPLLRDAYGEHQGNPVEVWSDRETIAAFRAHARLHNSLVPYLHSQARIASETGLPIMRHLALSAPNDPRAWAEEQSYTLGDDLLVAPVVEEGARLRTLYLPPGQWVDWWSGQPWEGGRVITVDAPLDRVPLLARAGAILPLATDFDTLAPVPDGSVKRWDGGLVIRVVAPATTDVAARRLPATTFRLYDGTLFTSSPTADSLTFSAENAPGERDFELRLPAPHMPSRVLLNGAEATGWSYANGVVVMRLRAGNFTVTVEY